MALFATDLFMVWIKTISFWLQMVIHCKSPWPLWVTAPSSDSFHLKAKKQQMPFKEDLTQDEKY